MDKKTLIILILFIISIKSYCQSFPTLNNDFNSDIKEFIQSQKKIDKYDFIILKYERSYWFRYNSYKLVCFQGNDVDLIEISTKRKNNKFKISCTKDVPTAKYFDLIDSLIANGIFNLTKEDFKTDFYDENGNKRALIISDGVMEVIEIYNQENSWGLSVYEAQNYYNFCKNENLLIFRNACKLFDDNWKNKN